MYYLFHRTSETDEAIPKVAVIREEGSNGDREMIASLMMVGFEVWDVNMQDICTGKMTLDRFRGIVFVGGFSFADVLGSAKGWAAVSRFNQDCQKQFSTYGSTWLGRPRHGCVTGGKCDATGCLLYTQHIRTF